MSTAGSGLRALVGVGAVDGVVTFFCGEPEIISGLSIASGLAGLSDESGAPGFAGECRAGTISGVSGLAGTAVLFDVSGLVDSPDPAGVSDSAGRSDPVGAVCFAGASGFAGATGFAGVPESLAGSRLTVFAGLCAAGAVSSAGFCECIGAAAGARRCGRGCVGSCL